jgi:putative transposase
MSQSLANIHTHLVFSTKNRHPWLTDDVRPDLHAYMATVLAHLNSPAQIINSIEDHVHILFNLHRTLALSKAVERVKSSSSQWLKSQSLTLEKFSWQSGYGAFSVSESNLPEVSHYISQQREHHRTKSFQEEYLAFLQRHHMDYDQQYIWD